MADVFWVLWGEELYRFVLNPERLGYDDQLLRRYSAQIVRIERLLSAGDVLSKPLLTQPVENAPSVLDRPRRRIDDQKPGTKSPRKCYIETCILSSSE